MMAEEQDYKVITQKPVDLEVPLEHLVEQCSQSHVFKHTAGEHLFCGYGSQLPCPYQSQFTVPILNDTEEDGEIHQYPLCVYDKRC